MVCHVRKDSYILENLSGEEARIYRIKVDGFGRTLKHWTSVFIGRADTLSVGVICENLNNGAEKEPSAIKRLLKVYL